MELASMLPGFRFLFSAIILSMSVLIFGLGAAALLRAAHEEFANLPSRRATPEPMFARLNDDQPPTLALLRIDPPLAEKPAENVPETTADAPAPAGQTPDARPVEPEKLAALTPAVPVQVEAAKPEEPAKETSAGTPAARRSRANDTTRMLFAVATPIVMIAPVRAGTLSVVPLMNSIHAMPASAAGSAAMMIAASIHDWKFTTTSR